MTRGYIPLRLQTGLRGFVKITGKKAYMIRKVLSTLRRLYKKHPALYSLAELFLFLGIFCVNMWVTRFWFWGIYAFNIHVPNVMGRIFFYVWHISSHLLVLSVIFGASLFALTLFVRKDSLQDLGIRFDNIKPSGKECLVAALIGANLFIAIFFVSTDEFTPNTLQYYLLISLIYIVWGTVQQFLLQSNILVRLIQILRNKNNAIVAAGVIFALLHAPNIPLMVLTFVVGLVCCILFSRHRNILTLGITHGVMAVMAFSLLVPGVIDNFRTGPMSNWHKAGMADFDADGITDILWRNIKGINIIWYKDRDGGMIKGVGSVPYRETEWDVWKIADFDADGVPDILWRNKNGDRDVWYMKKDGTAIKGIAPY
jgi:hypothetical protein